MNSLIHRHEYEAQSHEAQSHEAKVQPKRILNHESEALTFWEHKGEAKAEAEALTFSKV